MQSLMGGTPMANAPSNLGISTNSPAASNMQMPNGQPNGLHSIASGNAGASSSTSQTHSGSAEAAANAQGLVYPALHLHPLNDTFAPKQISLAPPGPNNRIKIGRQTNAKTVPNPTNGYFDSKVLSRMHAEVWSQNGKVYIKDVKSSNGTFINGERLSPEAQESDVFELHNEDMVEFGIDIVGDDNKTIIHHKVACRVYLVLTAEDALGLRNDFASLYRGGMHGGPLGSNGVGPGAEGGLRRSKAGFSFDHVLSKLQSELQRSKETWNDLGSITNTMHDIHETLGGGVPPLSNAPYPHLVPPPPGSLAAQQDQQAREAEKSAAEAHAATISALQAQLSDTQSSLAAHVEKIRSLESILAEHESIKQEVNIIKLQMEQTKREVEESSSTFHRVSGFGTLRNLGNARSAFEANDDFDDGASVASVETVTQNEEADSFKKHGQRDAASTNQHVGPRAPPDMPAGLVAQDAADLDHSGTPEISELKSAHDAAHDTRDDKRDEELRAQNAALSSRLEELASQLEHALALSRGLQSQHAQVADTVKVLEERVQTLEKEVEQKSASMTSETDEGGASSGSSGSHGSILKSIEGRFNEFKSEIEDSWRRERDGMQSEREELRKVVQAWDEANRRMEDELNADWHGELEHSSDGPSGSSSRGVLDSMGLSSEASSSTSSSSSHAISKPKRNANRRKRHVNSALRSLLYGSSAAGIGVGLHDGHDDEDVDWNSSSGSRLHVDHDEDVLSNSQSTRSIADSNSTRPSTATEVTTPDLSPGSLREGGVSDAASNQHARSKGSSSKTTKDSSDSATRTSAALAAGVVIFGLTAWIISTEDPAGRLKLALAGKA